MFDPIPKFNRHLRSIDQPLPVDPSAKEGLSVPGIVLKYGSLLGKLKVMPFMFRDLIGGIYQVKKSTTSIRKNPYLKKEISETDFHELQALINELGIKDYGIIPIQKHHLFKDSVVLFPNAIVFVLEMEKDAMATAPSLRANKEVFRTYHELGKAVNVIADFLRERGYNAQAIAALSNHMNLVPMAKDAGLGEYGYHGLLINKSFGPSLRLAAITTDITNLPMTEVNQHTWIQDFCKGCRLCIKNCPAEAIHETPQLCEDLTYQCIDYKKCAIPFSRDYGCSICIRSCPFFKTDYDVIRKAFDKRI